MNPARDKTRPRISPEAPMASLFFSDSGMDGSEDTQILQTAETPTGETQKDVSSDKGNDFLISFNEKVAASRALIVQPELDPAVLFPCCAGNEKNDPFFVEDVVGHLKPSCSTGDPIPARSFKQIFPSIALSFLNIINSSLSYCVVPVKLKHVVVQPHKKTGLDHSVLANCVNHL